MLRYFTAGESHGKALLTLVDGFPAGVRLDTAFGGNDQLKTNTVLEMKSHGVEFRTV